MNPYESPNSPKVLPVAEDPFSTDKDRRHPWYVVTALAISAIIVVLLMAFAIIYDLEIQADKEELEKAMKVINQK